MRRNAPCGITRITDDCYLSYYGSVLIGEYPTAERAERALKRTLDEELSSANEEILRADDHRNYVVGQIERIREHGPWIALSEVSDGN